MTFQEIKSNIKRGDFKPIYFLMGEEPYFIDALTNLLEEKVLKPEERSFNQTVLYGKDTDVNTVVSEAKRYPMMAERTLVLVKEAQHLKDWENLEAYAEKPQKSTVLVFAYKYKKLDKRKKITRLLDNHHVLFTSNKIYDNKVPDWIERYLKAIGYQATPKAIQLLADNLGTDLGRIVNELNKLELIVPAGSTINDEIVEQNIGISKDFNNFELQNAIRDRDFAKAMQIQKYFAANPNDNPMVLTLFVLYRFFSLTMLVHQFKGTGEKALAGKLKVPPYFVKDYLKGARSFDMKKCARIMGYMREADMRSKGVNNANTPAPELLKELLYKIFNA